MHRGSAWCRRACPTMALRAATPETQTMPAIPAAPPSDESKRLAALLELRVLDTLPEQAFDDIVALAAHICGTPIGLVSLVDAQRQWFKAKVGLAADETHRDLAFC